MGAYPVPGVLWAELQEDLAAVEQHLERVLSQGAPSVREVATHLLRAGGKRLRPALVLLCARLGRFELDRLVPVAAATELIHMATLIHDDILDGAELRRGRPTVHTRWNVPVAVLAGDLLFAEAFSELARTGDTRVVQRMADVVHAMCGGEIEEQESVRRPTEQSEDAYLHRIGQKTALFIAESCRLGALVAGVDEAVQEELFAYGYKVGVGFQIVDDVLDLTASPVFGKAVGSDLRSGVLTLPVLHALSRSPERGRLLEIATAREVRREDVEEVRQILGGAGSFGYALEVARRYVTEAQGHLRALPRGVVRDTLWEMADFVLKRSV